MSPSRSRGIRCTIVAAALSPLAAACSGGPGTTRGAPPEGRERPSGANDPPGGGSRDQAPSSADSPGPGEDRPDVVGNVYGCACAPGLYDCPVDGTPPQPALPLSVTNDVNACTASVGGQTVATLLCSGLTVFPDAKQVTGTWHVSGDTIAICAGSSKGKTQGDCTVCTLQR